MATNFPVGFHPFHKDEGLNFQLNRFYASGICKQFNCHITHIGIKKCFYKYWKT